MTTAPTTARKGPKKATPAPAPAPAPTAPAEPAAEDAKPVGPTAPQESPFVAMAADLLAQIRKAIPKVEVTEKTVYWRVSLGKTTLVYVNFPSRRSIRLEYPKDGGYEVVKVTTEQEAEAALARIVARVKELT
jgi:hypothetical protein